MDCLTLKSLFLLGALVFHVTATLDSQSTQAVPSFQIDAYGIPAFTKPIPEASKPGSIEVAEWWGKILTANQVVLRIANQLQPLIRRRLNLKAGLTAVFS